MRNVLTGIDVGTSKVCVLIAETMPEGGTAVRGYGVVPCTGLRRGWWSISRQRRSAASPTSEAEKSAGSRIGAVGGLPINLKRMPEELMNPMYTTAAGLRFTRRPNAALLTLARDGKWKGSTRA